LDEDVVFAEKREDGISRFEPISISELVKKVA
jgi:hypothetical protein